MNFNEIFRKNMSYDDIKSHEKPKLYHFPGKCSFGKTTGGWAEGVEGKGRIECPQPFYG